MESLEKKKKEMNQKYLEMKQTMKRKCNEETERILNDFQSRCRICLVKPLKKGYIDWKGCDFCEFWLCPTCERKTGALNVHEVKCRRKNKRRKETRSA